MASMFQVFISFKNLDEEGQPTRDSVLAREVYDHLTAQGLNVFLSSISLEQMGESEYKRAIDHALDEAEIMVVVGTSPENIDSKWVRYEWDSFYNDILSGVKGSGMFFTYVESVATRALPRTIRHNQVFQHPGDLPSMHRYILRALSKRALGRAREAMKKGRHEEAVQHLSEVVDREPDNSEAVAELEQARQALAAEQEARQKQLEQEERKRRVADLLSKADDLLAGGRFEEAIVAFEQVLSENPDHEQARKGLAKSQAGQKRELERLRVEEERRRAEEVRGQKVAELQSRAKTAFGDGHFKDAIECYEQILALEPDNAEAEKGLEQAQKAMAAEQEARQRQIEQEDRKRRVADLLAKAGDLLAGGRFEEAIVAFEQVLSEDPYHAQARAGLTEAKMGQVKEEEKKKKEIQQRTAELFDLAGKAFQAGRYQEAIGLYRQVLAQDTEHGMAKRGLLQAEARLAMAKKDLEQAQKAKAAEQEARQRQVEQEDRKRRVADLLSKADDLLAGGRFEEAIVAFEQVLSEDPYHAQAQADLMKAKAGQKREEKEKKKEIQQRAAELFDLAGKAFQAGRYQEAIGLYRQVLAQDAEHGMAKRGLMQAEARLATAKKDLEQAQKAKAAEQEARQRQVEQEDRKRRMADLLSKANDMLAGGRFEEAISLFKRVLEEDPDNKEAEEGLKKAKTLQTALENEQERQRILLERQGLIDQLIAGAEEQLRGGHLPKAMELFQQVLSVDPSHGRAVAGVQKVEEALGAQKQEEIKRDREAESQLAVDDLMQLAQGAMDERRYRDAIGHYREVLAVDAYHSMARKGLLQAEAGLAAKQRAVEQGRVDEQARRARRRKVVWLTAAVIVVGIVAANVVWYRAAREKRITSWLTSAAQSLKAFRFKRAIRFYELVLNEDPNNPRAQSGLKRVARTRTAMIDNWLEAAKKSFKATDFGKAIQLYKKVLNQDSYNSRALAGIKAVKTKLWQEAKAAHEAKKYSQARHYYRLLQRLFPYESGVATVLAAMNAEQKAAEEARPIKTTARAKKYFTNSIGMRFRLIPAGSFMMGSPRAELKRHDDEHQHRVVISRPFYMQTTEVTQGQYRAIMRTNPSFFKGCDRCPVERVSWHDAQEFIRRLNARERTNKYRLPTEAEWEYTCRAGTTTPFYFGATISTNQANYDGSYRYGTGRKGVFRRKTTPVGRFPPNRWGLYDMHGNVYEWCSDRYSRYYYKHSPTRDPKGPSTGQSRVLRGGSWFVIPWLMRSAGRIRWNPSSRNNSVGFRVVRDF